MSNQTKGAARIKELEAVAQELTPGEAEQAPGRLLPAVRGASPGMDQGIDYKHQDLYLNVWIN